MILVYCRMVTCLAEVARHVCNGLTECKNRGRWKPAATVFVLQAIRVGVANVSDARVVRFHEQLPLTGFILTIGG